MPVTTTDIAAYVGVSQPVVSKVLMGSRGNVRVGEATRKKVEAAARELGFRPNAAARSMKRGAFNTVGYMVLGYEAEHVYAGSTGVAAGACRELATHDVHMAYAYAHIDDMADGKMPPVVAEAMVDALLIDRSGMTPEALVEAAERYQLPHVAINTKREADCVYPDDFNGCFLATREMIELGHRKVLYVGRSETVGKRGVDHYSRLDRLHGYEAAMREAGLTPWHLPYHGGDRLAFDPALAAAIRDPDQRPTAVVCYGADLAGSAIVLAGTAGLSVPDDLSVITMHRSNMGAAIGTVNLDAMYLSDQRMGKAAAQMVLEKKRDPAKPIAPRTIDFQRSHGATVAPARH